MVRKKRGYTPTNIADEPLKMIKTGIFFILHRCMVSRYISFLETKRETKFEFKNNNITLLIEYDYS